MVSSGRVAQWKSSGLLSHWFWVRVPARSLVDPPSGGFLVLGPRGGDAIPVPARSLLNPPSGCFLIWGWCLLKILFIVVIGIRCNIQSYMKLPVSSFSLVNCRNVDVIFGSNGVPACS